MSHESFTGYVAVVSRFLGEDQLTRNIPNTMLYWVLRMIRGGQASAPYFSTPVIVLLGFFMVAYCYTSAFLIGSREDRARVFAKWLNLSAFCATLFATGVSYPIFRPIYLFFYRLIPGLLFNSTYLLHLLSIIYACMLGMTTYLISRVMSLSWKHTGTGMLMRKSLSAIMIGIAVISVAAYVYPVYTNATSGFRGYAATKIPEDYFQLHDLLNTKNANDYRLLVYPPTDHFVRYTWSDKSFHIIDFIEKFSPVPAVVWRVGLQESVRDKQGPGRFLQRALLDLDKANIQDAVRTLGILSIRYVFVHKDIYVRKDLPRIDYLKVARTLSSSPDIRLIKDSGNYMLFEINESSVVPMIYAVSATDINATGFMLNPKTLIRGHADSLGEYIIPIPKGKEVVVVLNQAYSSDWTLSGGKLKSTRIMVNDFANGWYVESTEETMGYVTLKSNVWASLGATMSIVNIAAFTVLVTSRTFSKIMRKLLSGAP